MGVGLTFVIEKSGLMRHRLPLKGKVCSSSHLSAGTSVESGIVKAGMSLVLVVKIKTPRKLLSGGSIKLYETLCQCRLSVIGQLIY